MRLNGTAVQADGVTAVGTLPNHRRRGLVRRTVTERLATAREHNQPVSILYASMGAIYQRFGYGLGCLDLQFKFDPQLASFQKPIEDRGSLEFGSLDDHLPTIKKLYRSYIEDRPLMLHRSDEFWSLFIKPVSKSRKRWFAAIHYDEDGIPDGFLNYRISDYKSPKINPLPDQSIQLRDFYCFNIQAFRALWEFLRSHDLVGEISLRTATDNLAPCSLLEPRALRMRMEDGLWLRIVDVQEVLSNRGYNVAGDVTLEIKEDDECPWNIGIWNLQTEKGGTHVSKGGTSPDFVIDINGLASLVSGQFTLSQLVAAGRAEIHGDTDEARINALFATKHAPFCGDGF